VQVWVQLFVLGLGMGLAAFSPGGWAELFHGGVRNRSGI
jgi:hypothetical protein